MADVEFSARFGGRSFNFLSPLKLILWDCDDATAYILHAYESSTIMVDS